MICFHHYDNSRDDDDGDDAHDSTDDGDDDILHEPERCLRALFSTGCFGHNFKLDNFLLRWYSLLGLVLPRPRL